jgi:bacillopeptidase F
MAALLVTPAALAGQPPEAPGETPASGIPLRTLAGPSAESKFEGGFEASLRKAPKGKMLRALIDFRSQVDLDVLGAALRARGIGKSDRREAVIRALETVAERDRATIRPLVDRLMEDGALGYVRPVAIVNRLVVEGTPAGLLALADHPGVAGVLPDWTSTRRSGRLSGPPPVGRPGDRFESWALEAMGVEAAWEHGLDGTGVVVGAIDTGVYAQHEQLRGRMLGGGRGWFDPVESRAEPYDSHGHGTSVMSQAVGGNPDGRILGAAPGARWAVALGNWRNHYSRVRMTLAADWILRVARPDVLVNAWSHDEGPCETFDVPFLDAWKAAEIFVVFPAGNAGPGPRSGEAPAQLSGVYPDGGPVFSVSGLGPDLTIHEGSSRGPSACGSHPFPRIGVPGAGLPFAGTDGPLSYGTGDGTSLAAGLIAGVAALLLQADPELSPDDLERLLVETARDLGRPGPDHETGVGIPNVPAALERIGARPSPSSPPTGDAGR